LLDSLLQETRTIYKMERVKMQEAVINRI